MGNYAITAAKTKNAYSNASFSIETAATESLGWTTASKQSIKLFQSSNILELGLPGSVLGGRGKVGVPQNIKHALCAVILNGYVYASSLYQTDFLLLHGLGIRLILVHILIFRFGTFPDMIPLHA